MIAPVGHAFLGRRRRLRAGFTQLVFVLVGVGSGLAVPRIDVGAQVPARQVADMLLAVGLGLFGVVVFIFSLLFLVVQWAATTYTPRLTLFRDDPIIWRTFAFAIGVAVFAVTAALVISDWTGVSVTLPLIGMALLLALLALLRTLQLRAFSAIQLAPALDSIGIHGRATLDAVYREVGVAPNSAAAPVPPEHSTITWPHPPAVLQQIHLGGLLEAARTANAVVVLRQFPGVTLQCGTPVADVHGAELPGPAVLGALVVGKERTFMQDPLLALRLLADIALRALSPAVNDPATAVQVLDELDDLLGRAAAIPTETLRFADHDGVLRIIVPLPGWDDFVRTGLDDILVAAATSPLALGRVRLLLERLQIRIPPHRRDLLTIRLMWVKDELAQRYPYLGQERIPYRSLSD